MRALIQRVKNASVSVEGKLKSEIELGLLVLLGIVEDDTGEDIDWLMNKIANLRIFDDENGVMNKSLTDVNGSVLIISQFTLHAKTKKGNRPSYVLAAKPDIAESIYEKSIEKMGKLLPERVKTGVFGAEMDVSLLNWGPVTIMIDSKNKE